jgi:putative DNA primase/helicase
MEAVRAALGDYVQVAQLELFVGKDSLGKATPEIARLRGVRFAYCNETDEGASLNSAKLKRLVGGDEAIVGRGLYVSEIEFRMTALLVLATNSPPGVNDMDEAIWTRLLYFAPRHSIPKEKRDPSLKRKLQSDEEAKSATLAMIVHGARRWISDGGDWNALKVTQGMQENLGEYRGEQNLLAGFIDSCVIGPGFKVTRRALRERYVNFCRETGTPDLGNTPFYDRVRKIHGVTEGKVERERGFWGIGILGLDGCVLASGDGVGAGGGQMGQVGAGGKPNPP